MTHSFKKPLVWIVLAVAGISAGAVSLRYFSEAFPLVNLEFRMDRESALAQAKALAERHHWGPPDFGQAASFAGEQEVQNFIELEGGGKEALSQILADAVYSPYTWRVRHFKEGETNETLIRFTPEGSPYGFVEKLAEDQPGPALSDEVAREIAETAVTADWEINLGGYQMVEQSRETRSSGRIDHTLVYERRGVLVGEGKYRLRLGVSGDRLTEITHFVQVPEAFQRRYQEMRSANQTIGAIGSVGVLLLYLVGGCFIGTFFLLRQGLVQWKAALVVASVIAALQALDVLNQWPLFWMGYDTAVSTHYFILQTLGLALGQFLLLTLLLSVSFIGAESLGRKAFPQHVQLWRSWSRGVANSPAVLGRTASGYLLLPLFFAYEVGLYYFTSRFLGWWTPSETLLHPDVLAVYFPWFSSIAASLQAGFWEECLFRAVPISGAVLLGHRYGHRRLWIAGAFLLQALIFGAGHAPYPNMPAYARVVELILPSVMFGLLYYYFGLIPGIVLHFAFDVVWFALPLFVSDAPGAIANQVAVICLALVPIIVVLAIRIRERGWAEIRPADLNAGWSPKRAGAEPGAVPRPEVREAPRPRWLLKVFPVVGLAVLGSWLIWGRPTNEAPGIQIDRSEAVRIAEAALSKRYGIDPANWRILASAESPLDEDDRFVWTTSGPAIYRNLIGSYLEPSLWLIRLARFEGDVEQRAEEFLVWIDGEGRIVRIRHKMPEAREGMAVARESARQQSLEFIALTYGLREADLREVSAEPSRRPNRTDWDFTFEETGVGLSEGEARISVTTDGEGILDGSRFIYIPENWRRQEKNRVVLIGLARLGSGLLLMMVLVAGGVKAVVGWSRGKFSVPDFLKFGLLMALFGILGFANQWPSVEAGFSTAEPLANQVLVSLFSGAISSLMGGLAVGLIAGLVSAGVKRPQGGASQAAWRWTAVVYGACIVGAIALARAFLPSTAPYWADFGGANAVLVWLDPCFQGIKSYLLYTSFCLLLFQAVDSYSRAWTVQKLPSAVALVIMGVLAAGMASERFLQWGVLGPILGLSLFLGYFLLFRYDFRLVPWAILPFVAMRQLLQGLDAPYPGSALAAGCAIAVTVAAAWFWSRSLSGSVPSASERAAADSSQADEA